MMELLLAVPGAKVNLANEDGETPLHLAADRGHLTTCLELLKRGWHDDVPNRERQTPRSLGTEHVDIHRLFAPLAVDPLLEQLDFGLNRLVSGQPSPSPWARRRVGMYLIAWRCSQRSLRGSR